MNRVISNIVGLAALVALMSGCISPDMHVTRLTTETTTAPVIEKPLKVYELGDKVDRPYEIVGVISATGNRGGVLSKGRKKILAEASTLGADALVGYYYDDEKIVANIGWAGALAVRFQTVGTSSQVPSKAVVLLPHTVIGKDLATGKKAEKMDAISRKLARYQLAKKGYYAVLVNEEIGTGFPDYLKKMKDADRLNYGSIEGDLVLAVTLGDRHAFNVLLVAAASQALGAAIYSKSANDVTWQNAARGNSFDFMRDTGLLSGVAHLFVPSAKTIESIRIALEQAFETLPNLGTPPTSK
jgi:hypothetical protein